MPVPSTLRPYTMHDPRISAGRVLLSRAVEHYCVLEWSFSAEDIEAALEGGSDQGDDGARAMLRTLARQLGALFAAGALPTWARPFGGGAPRAIPASAWEIDDFARRVATSALALDRPFDPAAAETHWIFVDAEAFQELIDRVFARWAPRPQSAASDGVAAGAAVASPPVTEAMLRLPEVKRRTGLSRSTIYDRAGRGTFPKGVPLGGGLTGWREAEVRDWIEALGVAAGGAARP